MRVPGGNLMQERLIIRGKPPRSSRASVEGARDHPITRGMLCAKVNDYEKRTYASDRLLRPLRRVGVKGEGRFEPISWDAAVDVTATRFQQIIREHGPAALFSFDYLGSMGVVQRRALRRIFHALGASRRTGSVCGASGNVLEAEGDPSLRLDPPACASSVAIAASPLRASSVRYCSHPR